MRSATRSTVTRTMNTAKEILSAEDIDSKDAGVKLRGLANLLGTKLNLLDELDRKIVTAWDDDDEESFAKEVEDSDKYQQTIYGVLAEIENFHQGSIPLKDDDVYSVARSSRSSSRLDDDDDEYRRGARPKRHIKRPTINMQTFDGNPMEYQTFMDSFVSSVDNDEELSKIDKFMYLKGQLKGKAKNTIEGLSLTAENYDEAISLLKSRYGDKKFLISTFFKVILDLKPIADCSDVGKLRDLYDSIEINVRNLKTLGITSDRFAPVIIPTILSKIPEAICHEVMKVNRESDWNFDAVLGKFQAEVVSREQCRLMVKQPTKKLDNNRERSGDNLSTGSSLFSSTSQREKKPYAKGKPNCCYCGESHKPWKCHRVTDIAKRKEILQNDGRCFNCLAKNCKVPECKSPYKCFKCQGKHHTSIHPPSDTSGENQNGGGETTTHTTIGGNGNMVLLKTAMTAIRRDNSSTRTVKARVILDDCSQRSYITRKLVNELQLNIVDSKPVIVKGICNTSTAVQSDIAKFQLVQKCGRKLEVLAGVLDEICAPISEPSVKAASKNYPHLMDISFADYHDGNDVKIDILIGGDYYYEIVSNDVRKGPPGTPTAVNTTLGWMVGGPANVGEISHTNLASICLATAESRKLGNSVENLAKEFISEISAENLTEKIPKNPSLKNSEIQKKSENENSELLVDLSENKENFEEKFSTNSTNSKSAKNLAKIEVSKNLAKIDLNLSETEGQSKNLNSAQIAQNLRNSENQKSAQNLPNLSETENCSENLKSGQKSENLSESGISVQLKSENETLDELLKMFWDLETIGIKEDEGPLYDEFTENIRYDPTTKKYEVRLPWKPNHGPLPDNFQNACRRLASLHNSLKKRPEDLHRYHDVILDQKEKGIIEVCEDTGSGKRTHYLPHRAVKRDSETTSFRVVYDASSKPMKVLNSLNDCLFKGPSLTPHLFDVLLRFRLHLVAFICDIQKAFLQIRVAEEDRDALRFLWFDDPFAENPKIVTYRFTCVLFGLNCSPFLLNGTLHKHLKTYIDDHRDEVLKILRSLYVDDFTGGMPSTVEAHDLFRLLERLLREGGFPVHKFMTNDAELRKMVDGSDPRAETEEVKKVLGCPWNTYTDEIIINLEDAIDDTEIVTKRLIASLILKIFDPLGLVSPITISPKVLLQESWQLKSSWDAPLPENIQRRWREWQNSLKNTPMFKIPRCYVSEKVVDYQLFGFCDASIKAFAAVVYLRTVSTSGNIRSMIVASKTRVAPVRIKTKTVDEDPTVPKLEMLSCCTLTTLMNTAENALDNDVNISAKLYFTDSTINLDRIRGVGNEYKPFEENRLKKIRSRSDVQCWYYIPTDVNPADIPSRGCLASELQGNELWTFGPEIVRIADADYYVYERELKRRPNVPDPAMKKNRSDGSSSFESGGEITMLSDECDTPPSNKLTQIIDLKRFSDFDKATRTAGYVLRFATHGERENGDLTCKEISEARKMLIISEQKFDVLSRGKDFEKDKANLRIFTDEDGLMRCRGRIENSELPYNTKFPIYIPRRSRLAELIVLKAHDAVFHQKERSTLTEIRTTYWIPRGRQLVRSMLLKCRLCKWLDSAAYTLPPSPPLPDYRLQISPPFSNVGFDHMGPLWVYDVFSKSQLHKVNVALFTCCVTRMVHLELQPSLDAPACIRAIKRTFARVGYAKRLVSDNHKTFRSKELKTFATKNSIEWKYILELSPHWGGFYERLNRIVKNALRKILRKSKLSYEELETILIEIEGVLNTRPLTYVDDSDLTEPLTPSHLMYGRNIHARPSFGEETSGSPTNRIKHVQRLLEQFWKRFSTEYLCSLRERDRVQRRKKDRSTIVSVGDIVLIHQKHVGRNSWPLGKVERIICSPDGQVRGAELRTESGQLNRPINLLHPLEMSC